jgi:hypothetical protein
MRPLRTRGPERFIKGHARDRSLSEAEIRALLIEGFDRARGIEIDDLYPPSTPRAEVHR